MGSKYSRVRGTNDFFFKEGYLHSKIEQVALQISRKYGFSEVKTPILEETNLFIRSMGETSDVAKKEMYNFKDKGDRDVCMRPE
jgi:histidyl-tRNA synthetase